MKKLILALVFLMAVTSGAFAQKHMVYGGAGAGLGVPCIADVEFFASYEFAIVPQFSVGGSVALQMYPLALFAMVFDDILNGESAIKSIFGYVVEGQLHWYPWSKAFHLDMGLGYSSYLTSMNTFLIAPGLGWRIDFGEPGGFVMNIGLRVEIFAPLDDSIIKSDGESITPVNFISTRLGFGYRF